MQQLLCFLHKSMDTSNQSQLAYRPTQTRYIILAGGSVGAQWRQPPPVQWESLILLKLPSARWTLPAHTKYNPSLVPPQKKSNYLYMVSPAAQRRLTLTYVGLKKIRPPFEMV